MQIFTEYIWLRVIRTRVGSVWNHTIDSLIKLHFTLLTYTWQCEAYRWAGSDYMCIQSTSMIFSGLHWLATASTLPPDFDRQERKEFAGGRQSMEGSADRLKTVGVSKVLCIDWTKLSSPNKRTSLIRYPTKLQYWIGDHPYIWWW